MTIRSLTIVDRKETRSKGDKPKGVFFFRMGETKRRDGSRPAGFPRRKASSGRHRDPSPVPVSKISRVPTSVAINRGEIPATVA